jgi:predicted 2-oxoglutarate/Fe(II)-dependent dioxygenase YbiX
MSKRLQVLLEDEEMIEVQQVARSRHLTVAEWVRQTLRQAKQEQPLYDVGTKTQVVREAARHSYPTGDIDEMLSEIGRGPLDTGES